MNIGKKSKGVWIMREEKTPLDKAKEEEIELEDPGTTLYVEEPIFLVNEAPLGKHLSRSTELNVPVVVILTANKFTTIEERMTWMFMNIPQIENVCVDFAGDESLVHHVKNKWIKDISAIKNKMKLDDQYRHNLLKNGAPKEVPASSLDQLFKKILNAVPPGQNPPKDPPPGYLFKKS